jgi:hypothetical protein
MLFSSSPRRVPLARPWPSCISAAWLAWALAPLTVTALPMVSVRLSSWPWLSFKASPARAMLAKVPPSSVKLVRLRWAIENSCS